MSKIRLKPMRWRKTGSHHDRRYELHRGGEVLAIVTAVDGGFYFYTMSRAIEFKNTAGDPVSFEAAKRAAVAWVTHHRTGAA